MSDFQLSGMIFLAEMTVVTCGTLRIIFVSRGHKLLAPCLGFFEIVIWLFAISQVMKHLSNGWCFLAFACGFTVGNFLGILIEKKLAMGLAQVCIVIPPPAARSGHWFGADHAAGGVLRRRRGDGRFGWNISRRDRSDADGVEGPLAPLERRRARRAKSLSKSPCDE